MLRQASILLGTIVVMLAAVAGRACWQEATDAAGVVAAESTMSGANPDGQHDFDFIYGKWRIHNRRLLHPLTGSQEWVEFEGTSVARKVWDGRANMDEYEADGPSGHIEGMTVRIYNPASREWSLYWANSKTADFSMPATIGHFTNGRGEFYDHEVIGGRPVLVRFLWLPASHKQTRWEQAFSTDEGKTWETNWIMDSTRVEGGAL